MRSSFHFCIFELLETTIGLVGVQREVFHFCIFELLETTEFTLFAINQGFKH